VRATGWRTLRSRPLLDEQSTLRGDLTNEMPFGAR
jgi:hypothetical protein